MDGSRTRTSRSRPSITRGCNGVEPEPTRSIGLCLTRRFAFRDPVYTAPTLLSSFGSLPLPVGSHQVLVWAGSAYVGYHFPLDVPSVRLAKPPVEAHPVATAPVAPGQLVAESCTFGTPKGLNEPATLPWVTLM